MISFRVESEGLGNLIDYVRRLSTIDFTPLGHRIARIAEVDNARARTAGLDREDVPFAPLRGARPLKPSEIRRRGGPGPPLAPKGPASRVIAGFVVEVVPNPEGGIVVRGSWPGLDWMRFHASGTRDMPRRDPAGLTPTGEDRVFDAVRDFLRDELGLY